MRILFIGCVESSYQLLSTLLENKKEVVGVITKGASKFNADYKSLLPLCEAYQIPYLLAENSDEDGMVAFVQECGADIGYCFGWSYLISQRVIDLFPQGMLGFHPAALPNNRGRHPIVWALALGLSETASTFFKIDEGADTGDIVSQVPITIDYEDDAQALYDKVMVQAVKQVIEFTDGLEQGTLVPRKQPVEGNSWRKRGKADGCIDWRMSTRAIYNLVRSVTHPYVGAHLEYNGGEYKVWKVAEYPGDGYENLEPGKVLAIYNDGSIDVKAYDGIIRLLDFEAMDVEEGAYLG